MRSNPRKAYWVEYEKKKKWHPFFARFPTLAYLDQQKGIEQWVWWEWIERRWRFGVSGSGWEYRIPK